MFDNEKNILFFISHLNVSVDEFFLHNSSNFLDLSFLIFIIFEVSSNSLLHCPVLILDSVNLWHEKYITPQTGRVVSSGDFFITLRKMINTYTEFDPYDYYKKYLSLEKSAEHIKGFIE